MVGQLLFSPTGDWLRAGLNEALNWMAEPVVATFVFIVVALLGVGHLLPRIWVHIEWLWLRFSLGGSPASRWVTGYAIKDFELSIRQRERDDGAPRPLAVLLAIGTRIKEYAFGMTGDLKRMKEGVPHGIFESAVNSMNHGWQTGAPPSVLKTYMRIIEASQGDGEIDEVERLRGMCSVALVRYALGDLRGGYRMGKRNWDAVRKLDQELQTEARWMASYAYFNSTLFLGNFGQAMDSMAEQWSGHYAQLSLADKRTAIQSLSKKITLNPILTIPRHIILAAAFNDGPNFGPTYWPASIPPDDLSPEGLQREITWVKSWYDEAKKICPHELLSLNFSHAYTGFYLTLLLPEANKVQRALLRERIDEAFDSIEDSSPVVSRYVKYGFRGVYYLVSGDEGDDEKALHDLRVADNSSAISGNRFAECIFMCCHAVAAARLANEKPDAYLEPEINHYLKQARKLSRKIGGSFYPALWAGAFAAVCRVRQQPGKVDRYDNRSRQVPKGGRRILRIFRQKRDGSND